MVTNDGIEVSTVRYDAIGNTYYIFLMGIPGDNIYLYEGISYGNFDKEQCMTYSLNIIKNEILS